MTLPSTACDGAPTGVMKSVQIVMDIIEAYDGDLIHLSGDDMLVAFQRTNQSPAMSGTYAEMYTKRKAALCCTEILLKLSLNDSENETSEYALPMKIAIGFGDYYAVMAGAAGYLNFFVYASWLKDLGGPLANIQEGASHSDLVLLKTEIGSENRAIVFDSATKEKVRSEVPSSAFRSHSVQGAWSLKKHIGFDEELCKLQEDFKAWRNGQSHRVLIAGSQGMGKTSLIGKFLTTLADEQVLICSGKGCANTESIPFTGVRSIILKLLLLVASENVDTPPAHDTLEVNRQYIAEETPKTADKQDRTETQKDRPPIQNATFLDRIKGVLGISSPRTGKVAPYTIPIQDKLESREHDSDHQQPLSNIDIGLAEFYNNVVSSALSALGESVELACCFGPVFNVTLNGGKSAKVVSLPTLDTLYEILIKLVQHICSLSPVIIVVDDLHWSDSQSYWALKAISTQCEKVFVLCSADTNQKPKFVDDAFWTSVVELKRLSEAEQVRVAEWYLGPAKDQHTKMITEIIRLANGNSDMLQLKTILCFAAVSKEEFNLNTILEVASLNMQVHEAEELIYATDHFRLLAPYSSNLYETGDERMWAFEQECVKSIMYEIIPQNERKDCHVRFGQYFEQVYRKTLALELLPLISEHYEKGDKKDKALEYLEIFADMLFEWGLTEDASQVTEKAIGLLTISTSTHLAAAWYSKQAMLKTSTYKFDEGRLAALKALCLMGFSWPTTQGGYRRLKTLTGCRQVGLWAKQKMGLRIPPKNDSPALKRALKALQEADVSILYLPKDEVELVAVMWVTETMENEESEEFVKACAFARDVFWLGNKKMLSRWYRSLCPSTKAYCSGRCISSDFMSSLANRDTNAYDCLNHLQTGQLSLALSLSISTLQSRQNSITKDPFLRPLLLTIQLLTSTLLETSLDTLTDLHTSSMLTLPLEHRGIFLSVQCFEFIRNGDFTNALVLYKGLGSCLDMMNPHQITAMRLLGFVSLVPAILVTEWDRARGNKVLMEAVGKVREVNGRLWERTMVEAKAAGVLLRSVEVLVGGGNIGNTMRELKKVLTDVRMNSFQFLRDMHLAYLARFLPETDMEKETYKKDAVEKLEKMGAKGLCRWATGGRYSSK
ncbi:hypothetical protein HDV05_003819 [Chytridiales sp. JEL 0842]|nr:hypothetical protein HDV05_003819 [Chytridiales sp. JEL 0842]